MATRLLKKRFIVSKNKRTNGRGLMLGYWVADGPIDLVAVSAQTDLPSKGEHRS